MKSMSMLWAGHVAYMGEKRNAHRVLLGKPEGKRPPGRPKTCRRIILKWILGKWGEVEWYGPIHLALGMDQWRVLVNTIMNLWVPENAGKLLSS
jgi:hypothetical protein